MVCLHAFWGAARRNVCAGEECYCVMDKGAINWGHVLLLPIEHFPSSLACSENAWAEMQRYLSALKACAASQVTPLLPSPPLAKGLAAAIILLVTCSTAAFRQIGVAAMGYGRIM